MHACVFMHMRLRVCSPVPYGPLREGHLSGCVVGKALVLCFLFMVLLGCVLYVMAWLMKKHKGHRERCCVAQGKHPNVVRGPIHPQSSPGLSTHSITTYFTL
jgi:hypothetical protein